MSKYFLSRFAGFFLLLLFAATSAAAPPINTLEKSLLFGYEASDIAIRGFDTVAYFTEGRAIEGTEQYSTKWNGAVWQFSSAEHLSLFEENPEKYAPQFGGYCAYGVSQNYLVKIEGTNWTIVDGKLYLNYDDSVQKKWESDIPGFISLAKGKFSGLLAQ